MIGLKGDCGCSDSVYQVPCFCCSLLFLWLFLWLAFIKSFLVSHPKAMLIAL